MTIYPGAHANSNSPVTPKDRLAVFAAFADLARLRIVGMVLVSCATGYLLSNGSDSNFARLFWTLVGTGLLSSGACALNCYLEREADALMPRTSSRPIPSGVISPTSALEFGVGNILLGVFFLLWKVNSLAAILGTTAVVVYLAMYTPAKRLTWMNTSIGAIPGAIPPLIGWVAAKGQLDVGAWTLFAMLFLWQHTHFFPIAWLYKEDYRKGGFRMLPVLESKARKTFHLTELTAVALLLVSMLFCQSNNTGMFFCVVSTLAGASLIAASCRLSQRPSQLSARIVLLLSLLYLPAIFTATLADRYGMGISSQHRQTCGNVESMNCTSR